MKWPTTKKNKFLVTKVNDLLSSKYIPNSQAPFLSTPSIPLNLPRKHLPIIVHQIARSLLLRRLINDTHQSINTLLQCNFSLRHASGFSPGISHLSLHPSWMNRKGDQARILQV